MAYRYVDPVNGSNGNNGTTFDLAWATLAYAIASGGLVAGDIVWVRRTLAEIPTATVSMAYNGTFSNKIKIIGCPRTTVSITSSDWTNGSNVVTIDDNNMVRERHQGRYIPAPNGRKYLITRVISSSSINIDREYSGTTVTNQATTICADEDYDLFQAIDDSAWTIKKTDWNGDAHNISRINYNDTAYQFSGFGSGVELRNLEFRNTTNSSGLVSIDMTHLLGCLFYTNSNRQCCSGDFSATRCIFEGNNTYGSRVAAYAWCYLKDCAIYGMGVTGLESQIVILENVNIGVEVPNSSHDLRSPTIIRAHDVKLGGTNGYILFYAYSTNRIWLPAGFENFQKVLGEHRSFFHGGYFDKVSLTSSSSPNKKVSDDVIRITPNLDYHVTNIPHRAYKICELRVWANTTSKSYRLWIYNNMGVTMNDLTATDNIFLKCRYINSYDDTSEYTYTEVLSSQIDIADSADDTDWDYLEVTGVQPAVAGWVILEVYYSMYSATGMVFIDPQVVIS